MELRLVRHLFVLFKQNYFECSCVNAYVIFITSVGVTKEHSASSVVQIIVALKVKSQLDFQKPMNNTNLSINFMSYETFLSTRKFLKSSNEKKTFQEKSNSMNKILFY